MIYKTGSLLSWCRISAINSSVIKSVGDGSWGVTEPLIVCIVLGAKKTPLCG